MVEPTASGLWAPAAAHLKVIRYLNSLTTQQNGTDTFCLV